MQVVHVVSARALRREYTVPNTCYAIIQCRKMFEQNLVASFFAADMALLRLMPRPEQLAQQTPATQATEPVTSEPKQPSPSEPAIEGMRDHVNAENDPNACCIVQ